MFFNPGIDRGVNVMYDVLLQRFHGSSTIAAWTGSLHIAARCFMGGYIGLQVVKSIYNYRHIIFHLQSFAERSA